MTTTTTNIADLQARLAPHAERLADIQAQIKVLEEAAGVEKAAIRALTDAAGPGTYGAGTHAVTISLNRRLDTAALAAAYPATEHAHIYKLTPDTSLVRKHLPPAVVEKYMAVIGEPRITVKDA